MNQDRFDYVCETARRAALFHSAADTLEWDERTGMPLRAGEYRGRQVSALRSAAHQLRTGTEYGDALQTLIQEWADEDAHGDRSATIRGLYRDHVRDKKLPNDLVARLSLATVRGQQVWDQARKNNSFAEFLPNLEEIVSLKQECGERIAEGTTLSVYEALVDEYEPDACVEQLEVVFRDLKARLTDLIARIADAPVKPDSSVLTRGYPIDRQREFSRQVAQSTGFDFSRGRLDETSHPFCTTLGPYDCRILTRYEYNWLPSGLYGTLHEAGHGMYEQGMREDWFGLPPGSHVSLGIHESQSRLWENQVGRSRPFWQWLFPHARQHFPEPLSGITAEQMYAAVNEIRPSLIRVEADEATYNLHILIRFELEQQIIGGQLALNDLPAAWNHLYRECLGVESTTDADGVLQDVHWSAGLFGYFPTYTLGNLAAAQFFEAARTQLGDLDAMIARGEFAPLLQWLRVNIHHKGRCFTGSELVQQATGTPLTSEPLMAYLESKLLPLYGLDQ